jgi:hypothetical protein
VADIPRAPRGNRRKYAYAGGGIVAVVLATHGQVVADERGVAARELRESGFRVDPAISG